MESHRLMFLAVLCLAGAGLLMAEDINLTTFYLSIAEGCL